VSLSEQIMSADKYPRIFSRQMKAIVYIYIYIEREREREREGGRERRNKCGKPNDELPTQSG